jgi:hypothetical protein
VDEYTDVENAAVAEAMADIVIDALNNPHKTRPEGECILGKIVQQQVSSNCLIMHSEIQGFFRIDSGLERFRPQAYLFNVTSFIAIPHTFVQ